MILKREDRYSFSENPLVNLEGLFYNRRTTKEKKEGNP